MHCGFDDEKGGISYESDNVLWDLTIYLLLVMQHKALIKDVTNIKLLTYDDQW